MINLLPPSEKDKVYALLLKKQFRVFGVLVVLAVFGGAFFVLNTLVFLKVQTSELGHSLNVESTSANMDSTAVLEDEIKDLNSKLSKYQAFRAEEINMGSVLAKIGELVPAGIALNKLSLDAGTKKIVVSGLAQTRDDVIVLEKNLKGSVFFERVDSPIGNYLQKSNSTFNFSFYFKNQ